MLESTFRSVSQSGSSLAFMMILAGGSITDSDGVVEEVVEEPPPNAIASPSPCEPAESGSPVDIIFRTKVYRVWGSAAY